MPTQEIIQVAKPHTIKKFELITKYVESWAYKILGYKASKGLLYIDCMSNSGHYHTETGALVDGSAITVARVLNRVMNNFILCNKRVTIYYNDKDADRIAHLRESLASESLSRVTIIYNIGDADNFLKSFNHSNHDCESSLLVYDPYQAALDWDAINPFLNRWGEVIINHMFSDTQRGAVMARKTTTTDKYEKTYQVNIEKLVYMGLNKESLDKIVEDIIIEQTRESSRREFVAAFPFYNSKNRILYSLVFCSGHIDGFELFKNTAWKIFGGKSSLKSSACDSGQLMFDVKNNLHVDFSTDDDCYKITDIAKYIFSVYHGCTNVPKEDIFRLLSTHPIFPTQGYRREIIDILKTFYSVQCTGKHKSLLNFPS